MARNLLACCLVLNIMFSQAEAFSLGEYFSFKDYFAKVVNLFRNEKMTNEILVNQDKPLLGDNSNLVNIKLERSYDISKSNNNLVNNNKFTSLPNIEIAKKTDTFQAVPITNNLITKNDFVPNIFKDNTTSTISRVTISEGDAVYKVSESSVVLTSPSATDRGVGESVASSTINECINCFSKRYIYYGGNFVRGLKEADPSFKTLIDIIKRGSKSGYNGIAINAGGSGSFTSLLSASPYHANFYTNMNELVKVAKEYNMEIVPVGLTPSSITSLRPDLEEAYPVYDTEFFVTNNEAKVQSNNIVQDSSFENMDTAWRLLDKGMRIDAQRGENSSSSVLLEASEGGSMMRLYREFKNIKPHTAYRIYFSIKTENFESPLHIQVYDGNTKNKLYDNQTSKLGWGTTDGVRNGSFNTMNKNQDWIKYNIDFNTLKNSSFRIYLGTWGNANKSGRAWIDNVRIEEIGLAHVVKRDTTRIIVKDAVTNKIYTENVDFKVETEKLSIIPGGEIKSGDKLLVTWWQSARGTAYGYGAEATACSEDFFSISNEIYRKTKDLLSQPKGFFIYYDEWRSMNWDTDCKYVSAGEYLSKTTKKLTDSLYSFDKEAEIYIWNDMYDPYANAVDEYYMVNGSLINSHVGLDKRVIIANWNQVSNEAQLNSLKFFSDLGNRQILSLYYDDSTLAKTDAWINNLKKGEQEGVKNVIGFMYTAWRGDNGYADLERVAERIKVLAPDKWPQ